MHGARGNHSNRSPRYISLLTFTPAALACLVAISQWSLVRSEHLSPWKGGGFGMFSTNDRATSRSLRIWVTDNRGEVRVDVPVQFRDAAGSAATFPSQGRLRGLAEGVMGLERAAGNRPEQVRVRVYRTDYVVGTLAPRRRLLREFVLDR